MNASQRIDGWIANLCDWRGAIPVRVRKSMLAADRGIVEARSE